MSTGPSLDGLSLALSQISFAVTELSKKNYKSNAAELKSIVQKYGPEAERHLFRCLLSFVDFNCDNNSNRDIAQVQLFIEACKELVVKPNFVSVLCYALEKPESLQKSIKPSFQFLHSFSKVLKLSKVQEVVFGIGLQSSKNIAFQTAAHAFVKQKLPELLRSYIESELIGSTSQEAAGLGDVAIEVLHLLLAYLLNKNQEESIVSEDQLKSFLNSLRKDFPWERAPAVLAPLLYPAKQIQETSSLNFEAGNKIKIEMLESNLMDIMEELGYGCIATREDCRETISHINIANLTPAVVAMVLAMMARTRVGLDGSGSIQNYSRCSISTNDKRPQSWNVEIFIDVLKEIKPSLNWLQVMQELDHPGFFIKDPEGLQLILFAYYKSTNNSSFPIQCLYKTWINTIGQLSWIETSLNHPDVFCFGDMPSRSVDISLLKSSPDETNREMRTWKSLDLVEILLHLSESGSYENVLKLFAWPVKNCPDVLVLALLQVTSGWYPLRNDLISMLMPLFLMNHQNSMCVLHYTWHGQTQSPSIRQLVMQSMADWYLKAEKIGDQAEQQTRLSRILDVAQDLKALSILLNSSPFSFVIDLAALASRREYLKLDKWLADKLREHQEPFTQALVNFLKRRCPQLLGLSDKELPKAVQLPPETISTTLSCLHQFGSGLSLELTDTIKTMLANHGPLMKPRPGNSGPNVLIMPPKRENGFSSPLAGMSPSPIGTQPDSFSSVFGLSNAFNNTTSSSSQYQNFNGSSLGGFSSSFGSINNMSSTAVQQHSKFNNILSSDRSSSVPIGSSLSSSSLSSMSQNPLIPQLTGNISPAANSMSQNSLISQFTGNQSQNFSNSFGLGGSLSGGNITPISSIGSSGSGLGSSSLSDSFSTVGSSLNSQAQRRSNPLSSLGASSFSAFTNQSAVSNIAQNRQADRLKQGDISAVVPGMDQTFSKEVDDEANSYFQRIYNQPPNPTMSIDEVLAMLKRFKDSTEKKERDVFLCMLRNLFEEYRFLPKYPEKELLITASLFGGFIEQGFVTYMGLGIALRHVLDALRYPPGTKMYMFGTAALDRFKTRLKDYPHYCQHLASIPHYKEFPPNLVEYIAFGQRHLEPPNSAIVRNNMNNSPNFGFLGSMGSNRVGLNTPTDSVTPPPLSQSMIPVYVSKTSAITTGSNVVTAVTTISTTTSKEPSIAITTNIDTLLDATQSGMIQPGEVIQDKVHFIFNNISAQNIKQKATDLKQTILPEYYPWLAQYLVMKRVSIEPNFHSLYSEFLQALSVAELSQMVLDETYRNIKVLLRSDKGPANFSDRSLLKNLGHWLGIQTLGNNKPILFKDLEVKSLLIEAFFKGQQELLYVVPFVAKILEACAKSKIFKPYNPWLMGAMSVMVELHQMPDLKLNLKFEVEVLCNTLLLDLQEIKPSELLKNSDILNKLEHQLIPAEKEKNQNADSSVPVIGPPAPMFAYNDIIIGALAWLGPHIQLNPNIVLFQQYPHLKQCIRPAIERAVQELLFPVVERSIKLCLTTAEMIVKKDFSLDPEETRMRIAAHHMVRNLTAGMAMITCREPLLASLVNNIKNNLSSAFRSANLQQKDQLEQAAQIVASENFELCCVFIQKTAVERALHETDKRLLTEYELRKHARSENRRYCDPFVLTYQAERMPEQIRLKVGGVTAGQMTVYEEFARSIPGFLPPQNGSLIEPFPKPIPETQATLLPQTDVHVSDTHKSYMPDDVVHILGKCAAEIEQHIHHMEQQAQQLMVNHASQHLAQLHNLLDMVVNARVTRDNLSSLRLIRKAVEGVLETMLPNDTEMALRYKDCHLIVLRGFQDPRGYGPLWTARQVLKVLADLPPEVRFNFEGIDILCRAHLITMREFDGMLAQWIDGGHCMPALQLAVQLCRLYLIEEKNRQIVTESDLSTTLEVIKRAYQNRQNPEGLSSLLEGIHANQAVSNTPGSVLFGGRAPGSSIHGFNHDFDDVSGLHEKVEYLLREWVRLYHHQSAGRYSEKAFQAFVPQLHQYGILKTDDLITRFFKYCTEICVDLTYRALQDYAQSPTQARTKCFPTIDAYCRLIALLVKHSGDNANSVTKINLLNRVLGIIGTVVIKDHEYRQAEFHQLAYHRMFVMLLIELNAPEPVLEAINFQILSCFANVFHDLRPSRAPGFSYSWLELIAHRTLMSKLLLNSPQQKGWSLYHQLLIDLFQFLSPFLRNVELAKQTYLIYKGTLRVLLVLLHDFPEFLCDYHFSFCDVIPPNCIQMRNLILSAFPRNMRLPDPFTPNLKVDLLNDIAHPPRILTNFAQAILPPNFKRDLDSYLKTRAPVTFLSELRSHLQSINEPGTRYNVPLMNALVLYVGTQAISYIQSKSGATSVQTITHSSHMDIFQNLAVDLDTEGRYLYLNAIANQLRYPNSHTHYFSCTLLYLFAEANSEAIQEQITRVLLERLIVNRPHPWGLLITFIELIKNHNYKFWNHDFVHCAPEIEKLFESVARSCMQPKQPSSHNGSEEGD
ncbi:CCR4-NOT transcription complex subunit 1 isoform X1 [Hydra vulgaris]|uniref:CCR4-NOT transcription complex subunit 1 isoform X1 n=1 Tax=Hydra vulgaris TaxID=6087 RepID=UPI000641003E|nr:CCR4-NOT transcription complex subunit 1 isoform X1 [Hydra vulgaris]